ncbi:MAG: 4'-phosphopantetheinyl transferase superfamily protein [Acidobacteriota bacterium]
MPATPPCPAPHAICAWHAHIDRAWPSSASHEQGLGWLAPRERDRYGRFRHDADREMFLLGRVMARTLVGRALGRRPDEWPWREGPRGRPEIDLPGVPLSFNVAHSGGIVVCALGREAEVGIDIEDRGRARLDRDLVDRYCSPAEIANIASQTGDGWRDQFLKYWTLKEAYLKARGLGIAVPLSDLSFTLVDNGHVTVEFINSLVGADPAWAFDLRALGDHFVALAASTPQGVRPVFSLDPLPADWLP